VNTAITLLLNAREFTLIWFVVPFYAVPVFAAGWYLGKKDNEILPLAVTGLKFHLITYSVANIISLLKHQLGLASLYERIETVYLTTLFWGLGVLLHYTLYLLIKRKSIKGIEKNEIFE
jgi:hypothetical protein